MKSRSRCVSCVQCQDPQTGCPLPPSISISGDNHAPRCLVFCGVGINCVKREWCNKALYFFFFFLFFLLIFLSLFSLLFCAVFFAFCNFPFLYLILLICIYLFRCSLMFPVISLSNFSLFFSYFSSGIITFCRQFL
jgi:hypothetical protein